MKRARPVDANEEAGQPKPKVLIQPTLHAFFEESPAVGAQPSIMINPSLQYGIQVYTTKETEGLGGQFEKFWDEKAVDLCENAASRKKLAVRKTKTQRAIPSSWTPHKTSLAGFEADELWIGREAYQEDENLTMNLATIQQKCKRMKLS